MDHKEIRHKLSEYIDGSGTSRERVEIESHLKACSECAEALRELRKTIDHVRTVEELEPPAWMTGKIMAQVREEKEKQRSWVKRFFLPIRVKLPVQALAVVFLAITAFYIYRSIQPGGVPSEPGPDRFAEREAQAPAAPPPAKLQERQQSGEALHRQVARNTQEKEVTTSGESKSVAQSPQYKSLEMKYAYERPAPPKPLADAAPSAASPAPVLQAERGVMAKKAPAADNAGPSQETDKDSALKAEASRPASSLHPAKDGETDVAERYENGTPRLIESFRTAGGRRYKLGEERFDQTAQRHGIQREFYPTGQVKAEAEYEQNRLVSYREYTSDGVKRTGKSEFDWYWLKKH